MRHSLYHSALLSSYLLSAGTHVSLMWLLALRRLMPVSHLPPTSTALPSSQLQRRLAHICPPSIYSPTSSHRAMSTTSNTSASTAPSTSTSSNPITFTPRHDTLADIQPHHRVLFVGDVHGCFDELQALIAEAGVTAGTDYILLAGDLINKGPKPLELIEWLRTTPRAYSVLGNHDHHVIKAMQRQAANQLSHATQHFTYDAQPHDYIAAHLTPEQQHYYLSLPLTIRLPCLHPPHLLVHAGLVPGVPLDRQLPFDLMNIRNVLDDGSGSKKKTDGVNWVQRYGGEEGTIVFGHCAARGVQLVEKSSGGSGGGGEMLCVGLDSGCCYGKELSGWLLPDKRLVQVKAYRMYAKPDD